jgi:hypothetical protein
VHHILTAIPRLLVLGAPLCLPCHPGGRPTGSKWPTPESWLEAARRQAQRASGPRTRGILHLRRRLHLPNELRHRRPAVLFALRRRDDFDALWEESGSGLRPGVESRQRARRRLHEPPVGAVHGRDPSAAHCSVPWFFYGALTYGLVLLPFSRPQTIWLLPLVQGLLAALCSTSRFGVPGYGSRPAGSWCSSRDSRHSAACPGSPVRSCPTSSPASSFCSPSSSLGVLGS